MKFFTRQTGHLSYRPDIDGLRALAILCVVGFHAFPAWAPGGFIGVDIFFVTSGFLISGILLADLEKEKFSLGVFYARRVRRIFPALITVLIAVLVGGWFLLWPDEYRQLARHMAGGAGFIVNFLLARENGYFDLHAETKPLLHLWSLGVEEQFYIFWPLLLAAAWRWKHRAGLMIAGVIALSFAMNIWLAEHNAVADFYWPWSRFWELLAGGALAWAARHKRLHFSARGVNAVLSWAGLALILSGLFALDKNRLFPGWLALLPVTGAVCLIAAGEAAWFNRKILSHPLATGIGLISYPLYLWHWPLLSFAQIMAGEAPSRTLRIEMVALSFVLAFLTYWLIEKPLRGGGLGKKKIGLLLGAMILTGGAALAIIAHQGVPARFAALGDAEQALDSDRLITDWQQNARLGSCHLQGPAATEQAPDCIENTRPLLWLWGDSHAAALYPGLKALQAAHGFGIAQMTQAGCPPLLDLDLSRLKFRPNCNDLNRRILARAAQAKPDLILLDAAWSHDDYPMENADIVAHLAATLAQIKQAVPGALIIIVGPGPRWLAPLPALYRRALTFTRQMPPARMAQHLDSNAVLLDQMMRDAVQAAGIIYLSPQDQLCDASGCLTRLNDDPGSIGFVDDEHLSPQMSAFLIEKEAGPILTGLGLMH